MATTCDGAHPSPRSARDNESSTTATHKRKAEGASFMGEGNTAALVPAEVKRPKVEAVSLTGSEAPCSQMRIQTPPPPLEELEQRTPGRVGPYKKSCECKPDIKPFKGPKGQKVRKSSWEKEQEYTDFVLHHDGHPFHELHVCYARGPDGPPTYDKAGFELDYEKVAHWMKPLSRASLKSKRYKEHIEKMGYDHKKEYEIFFDGPVDSYCFSPMLHYVIQDKVSKDLQIPFHKVGLPEFEEWQRRGFPKARFEDYYPLRLSDAQYKRLSALATGASLRK